MSDLDDRAANGDAEAIGEIAEQLWHSDLGPWLLRRMNKEEGAKYPTPPMKAQRRIGELVHVCHAFDMPLPPKLYFVATTLLNPPSRLPPFPKSEDGETLGVNAEARKLGLDHSTISRRRKRTGYR